MVRRHLADHPGPSRSASPRALLVACSGGPDSVALLGLLHCLAPSLSLRLAVGHVDHGLRPESEAEALGVRALAQRLDLPFFCRRVALCRGPGLPARARDARRDALREQADQAGASVIALGHTATDQAETMLLHLCRGAGLDGVAAMPTWQPDSLRGSSVLWLRPLLDLDRGSTRALAEHLQLPFVDDPTNLDRAHPRVRVRHEVLAQLRTINPRVEEALARASVQARQAEQALAQWVDAERAARRIEIDVGQAHADPTDRAGALDGEVTAATRWTTEGMSALPPAVRTRFVRRLCTEAGVPHDGLSAGTLAAIDAALARPGPPRSWDLHPRQRLCLARGALWIEARPPTPPNH